MDLALFDKTQLGSMADDKPARLTIKEFVNAKLFITNITGGAKPNFQLMYSLGDDVFLNTFSERLSIWELRGLHILTDCNGADVPGEPPFLTFYKQYNIKTERTVSMSFAGITMKGYLVDLQIKDYNQNGVEGFAFVLQYLALLQNLDSAGAAGSSASGESTVNDQAASDFGMQVLRSAGFELPKSDSALTLRSSNLPRV
jgi:hypothetical protein